MPEGADATVAFFAPFAQTFLRLVQVGVAMVLPLPIVQPEADPPFRRAPDRGAAHGGLLLFRRAGRCGPQAFRKRVQGRVPDLGIDGKRIDWLMDIHRRHYRRIARHAQVIQTQPGESERTQSPSRHHDPSTTC